MPACSVWAWALALVRARPASSGRSAGREVVQAEREA